MFRFVVHRSHGRLRTAGPTAPHEAVRVTADRSTPEVLVLAWLAPALTALALLAEAASRGTDPGWLGSASVVVTVVAVAAMLWLAVRLGAMLAHRDQDTRQSVARYRQIVDTAQEGVLMLDTHSTISVVNQRAADILGYSMEELVGHHIAEFSEGDAEGPGDDVTEPSDRATAGRRETRLRRKDGSLVSVLFNESRLVDRNGVYAGRLGMLTDLTERNSFEDELAFQALHDPLTALPNRLLLVDRLELALARAGQEEAGVAVVYVDVDGFKEVNRVHGHGGGDQLLTGIAGRLAAGVGDGGIVARFGGDEFVVVAEGKGDFAAALAERLRAALDEPHVLGDALVGISTSIGVATGRHGDPPATLLRDADMALLQAKANGRGRTEFFTDALRSTSRQRLELLSDLRRAVDGFEFSLRFQPVVSLDDGRIIGAEALIRWEHPHRGTLGPLEFIPVAEETGLINPIGRWVIEETCRWFAGWQRLAPDLSMSLNISARQLTTGVLDIVDEAVAACGMDPSRLALEITEGVLMDDVAFSVEALTALRGTGVMISIDDFGTGYSSLSYLNRFPVDVLKIDQSFVAGLPDDAYDVALVQAVLAIADALHLSVVAEGVENAAQAETLGRLGCNRAQGYHFHRPLTAEDFEAELVAGLAR